MSLRTEKRIGEISVNENNKHEMPSNTKNLFVDLYDAYKDAKKLTAERLGGIIMETHFGLLPEKKDKKLLE